jgi:DNA-binding NtrC family response regulator
MEGKFREDLYYRLNIFQLEIPPLRQRREDIQLLVNHFIEKICTRERRRIVNVEPALYDIMKDYWWPGNVRQLENAVYRAIIMCEDETLTMRDFDNILSGIQSGYIENHFSKKEEAPDKVGYVNPNESKFKTLAEHEKDIIQRALNYYNYNISRVSKILSIGRSTLYRKMKEYNIDMKGSLEELDEFKRAKEA